MTDIAIRVEGLSKQYHIGARQERYRTFRDTVTGMFSRRSVLKRAGKKETVWALKDVSFEVPRGAVLGIIGRNGAGKSTLLKILGRITEPTTGYADIYGRVGSLLEVGTGFHPELTGRENIYLNGAILGMQGSEIARQFDGIVAFAEVEKFVDTPVKHYSSGMYLRLAFAVAAHLQPEILLVDEVLAVGDHTFQKKCLTKMGEIAHGGLTVFFVSHNLAAVRQLCSKALLLVDGMLVEHGLTEDVIRTYTNVCDSQPANDLAALKHRKGQGRLRFLRLRYEDQAGVPIGALACGHPARIVLSLAADLPHSHVRISLTFRDLMEQKVMHLDSKLLRTRIGEVQAGCELVCQIPRVCLAPGRYRIELWLQSTGELEDWLPDAGWVDVIDGDFYDSGVALPAGYQQAVMEFTWLSRHPDNVGPSLLVNPLAQPIASTR